MPAPEIRPMLPADVEAATEMILSNDWGVRRDFLAFATSQPACVAMLAEVDGETVATGVGTANGGVGWIGTIFVDPRRRGQGLGRTITQSIIDRLEAGGVRTLVLVATADGRRLYAKMGFEVQTRYRILEAPGLEAPKLPAPEGELASRYRPFRAGDLDALAALDRVGTGEDRAHILRRFATPDTAKVLPGPNGTLAGFLIRAPWGGGATVADSVDGALEIVRARRIAAGPTGRVRVGLLQENEAGVDRLHEVGFQDSWAAPRMARGEPMLWHPEWIWGQFNHAIG